MSKPVNKALAAHPLPPELSSAIRCGKNLARWERRLEILLDRCDDLEEARAEILGRVREGGVIAERRGVRRYLLAKDETKLHYLTNLLNRHRASVYECQEHIDDLIQRGKPCHTTAETPLIHNACVRATAPF